MLPENEDAVETELEVDAEVSADIPDDDPEVAALADGAADAGDDDAGEGAATAADEGGEDAGDDLSEDDLDAVLDSGGNRVPVDRFNTVNEKFRVAESENAALKAAMRAKGLDPDSLLTGAAPTATQEPEPVDVDGLFAKLDELSEEADNALVDGDMARKKEIRLEMRAIEKQIDDERRAQIKAEARAEAQAEQAAAAERRQKAEQDALVQEFNKAAVDVLKKYPALNAESKTADQEAIDTFVFFRDKALAAGKSVTDAFATAAQKTAVSFDWEVSAPAGKPDNGKVTAITRGAKAAAQQPSRIDKAGHGGRAEPLVKLPSQMSDDEFDKLTEDQLDELERQAAASGAD